MSAWSGQARARLPRVAPAAVERARLTVVPHHRTPAPRMPFVALVSFVLLAGVLGLLMFNTHMQQTSFRVTALEAEAQRLHAMEQSLQMEIDRLRDPQRVATRAQGLGMVPLANPAFIRLSDGRELGSPRSATPAERQRLNALPTRKPAAWRQPPVEVPAVDGAPSPARPAPGGRTDDQE